MGYQECSNPTCGNAVFATGLCRKHYEQARLATAAPCSFEGCQARSYRGDLCITHYRLFTLSKRPKCIVPNCGMPQKSLSRGMCDKHDFRVRRHGKADQTRQIDWGSRESHPLYSTWAWHKRKGAASMCDEWRADFWAFVKEVQEKPHGHTLRRENPKKPIGPMNWYWKKSESVKDAAAYQRLWRQNNYQKATEYELKRRYNITMQEYERMMSEQGGVCAICKQPEQSLDKDGGPRRMPVDHCHTTGKVRGLLCTACNRALGLFKDSTSILHEAITYLERNTLDTPLQTR